jgi:hypothetical protein
MPKNRIILIFGALIALLPVLGFPHSWEASFQVVIGISIVLLSIWASIDKRISLKAKAQRRQIHKLREAEITRPTLVNQSYPPGRGVRTGSGEERLEPFSQEAQGNIDKQSSREESL